MGFARLYCRCSSRPGEADRCYVIDGDRLTLAAGESAVHTVFWRDVVEIARPSEDCFVLVHRGGALTVENTEEPIGQVLALVLSAIEQCPERQACTEESLRQRCSRAAVTMVEVAPAAFPVGLATAALLALALIAALWLGPGGPGKVLVLSLLLVCAFWAIGWPLWYAKGAGWWIRVRPTGLRIGSGRPRVCKAEVPWSDVRSMHNGWLQLRDGRRFYLGNNEVAETIRDVLHGPISPLVVRDGPPPPETALSRVTGEETPAQAERGISLTPGDHDA